MKMQRLGIVNLGLTQENFGKFKDKVGSLTNGEWTDTPTFHYREINPTDIASACDALVLSPGDAKIGLLDYKRDSQIGPLYNLIHNAIEEGIPLLGINAGHQALNCAYGWAVGEIANKKGYQEKQDFKFSRVNDQIVEDIESITMQLTNNYGVLPAHKQRGRWGQSKVKQLAHFMDHCLISRLESETPIYGVQFNIQPGTEPVFRNFFDLAFQYLQRKQAL